MRSSYGFHKFVQAIYVVFDRAAIVTSHGGDAVSASAARSSRDASLHALARSIARGAREVCIFIEKNRVFRTAHA
jgi:hypothetical protein